MSRSIWKYELELVPQQTIDMPQGAEFLCIQEQYASLCLWAIVTPDGEKELRTIALVGTGHGCAYSKESYIDTVQQGAFVWHFFEVKENSHDPNTG